MMLSIDQYGVMRTSEIHPSSSTGSIRNLLLLALSVGVALLASACIDLGTRGSGEPLVETLELSLGTVRNVEISDAWNAEIREGEASVVITVDDNLRDNVRISVDESTLKIEQDGSSRPNVGFNVVITLPEIDSIKAKDASDVVADGISVAMLEVEDASSLLVTDSKAAVLQISASDASDIEVSGSADTLAARVSDASTADLRNLVVNTAEVEVSDASSLDVYATNEVTGSARDASNITVFGDPSSKISTSDASSVEYEK